MIHERAVFSICWRFDPEMPLWLGDGVGVGTPEEVGSYLSQDSKRRSQVEELVYGGVFEAWLTALGRDEDANFVAKVVRDHPQNIELGVYVVCWRFDPRVFLWLEAGVGIQDPEDLATYLSQDPRRRTRVEGILYGGVLEAWLLALRREENAAFVAKMAKKHGENRELGVYAACWRFRPKLPFPFSDGMTAATPEKLVALIDQDEKAWERGKRFLKKEWITTWIEAVSPGSKLLDRIKEVFSSYSEDWDRKLEEVLHVIDPNLPWPQPVMDVAVFDLGDFYPGERAVGTLQISNPGRGYLWGTVSVQGEGHPEFKIEPAEFSGNSSEVVVTASGHEVEGWNGVVRYAELTVAAPGGSKTVPMCYRVKPRWEPVWKGIGWGGLAGFLTALFLFRPWASAWVLWLIASASLAGGVVGLILCFHHISRRMVRSAWMVLVVVVLTMGTLYQQERLVRIEQLARAEQLAKAERDKRTMGKLSDNFMPVPAGCFQMGSKEGDLDEQPVHEVCLDAFEMSKYEVTQGHWKMFMGVNPSYYDLCGDNCPVEEVSWENAQDFLSKVNESQDECRYRLPTEAEWEYACRGGEDYLKGCGGGDVEQVTWYGSNSKGKTHPVGLKEPNGYGLYDMSGNVWEWVSDWYGANYYANSPGKNPPGPNSGSRRVIRGSGWSTDLSGVRATDRNRADSGARNYSLGFRLARVCR